MEVYGYSIASVPPCHRDILLKYQCKPRTPARVKELQSYIIFFSHNRCTDAIGVDWKRRVAKDVNVYFIVETLKAITCLSKCKVHRVCKSSYPLYVFISSNYNVLRPFLESFYNFNTASEPEAKYINRYAPYEDELQYIVTKGYDKTTACTTAKKIASIYRKINGVEASQVTSVSSDDGSFAFVVFSMINGKHHAEPIIHLGSKQSDPNSALDNSMSQVFDFAALLSNDFVNDLTLLTR